MKILCVIAVLYNCRIDEMTSWELFQKMSINGNIHIAVVDNSENSDIQRYNAAFQKNNADMSYFSSIGNIGLSKAYNTAIGQVPSRWYMLADDDTLFSEEYISNVLSVIEEGSDLICGLISADGNPFSPVRRVSPLATHKEFITQPGRYSDIIAINSGLVISKDLLDRIGGFDERLFLDLVDYNLMETLSEINANDFLVVPGEISQSFSGTERKTIRESWPRFRIYAHDAMAYCEARGRSSAFGCLLVAKRFAGIAISAIRANWRKLSG